MGAEIGVQNMCMEMAAEMAGKMALGSHTRTQLPVYFRFTSGNFLNHRCWTAGRQIPVFEYFVGFQFVFQGFLIFSLNLLPVMLPKTFLELLGTRTRAKCKKTKFRTFRYLPAFRTGQQFQPNVYLFRRPLYEQKLRALLNESYVYKYIYMYVCKNV